MENVLTIMTCISLNKSSVETYFMEKLNQLDIVDQDDSGSRSRRRESARSAGGLNSEFWMVLNDLIVFCEGE